MADIGRCAGCARAASSAGGAAGTAKPFAADSSAPGKVREIKRSEHTQRTYQPFLARLTRTYLKIH
jgi:hypothetical protein